MAHTLDVKRIREVLDTIESETDKLTTWEQQFIESVSDQYTRKGSLSEKQLEIVETIYMKV